MPNNHYLRGRKKEWAYKDMLLKEGYTDVRRTRGSHSPDDLVATNGEECLHIQLKSTTRRFTAGTFNKELEEFRNTKLPISCFKRFVVYSSHAGQRGWHTIYEDY